MANAQKILKNDPEIPSHLDFKTLREAGLTHIASFSGDLWTDHNVHDPGITILEVLCYALMDLGYRTNLKTEDLLALKSYEGQKEDNFFTPAEILTCNPLTILDYRKLLIDIEGVRNAWLEVADEQEVAIYLNCEKSQLQFDRIVNSDLVLNGLYKIFLDIDSVRPQDIGAQSCGENDLSVDRILTEAKNSLQAHRNLSEDFLEIIILKDEEIGLCMDIELKAEADPEDTLALIFSEIQKFFAPYIRFYTLHELLQKGKSTDDIFEGRPFTAKSHGFIDTDELQNFKRIREIHVSDLYKVILHLEQVVAIKRLSIRSKTANSSSEEWCLRLKENHRPVLSLQNSQIRFYKGPLPFSVDLGESSALLSKKLSTSNRALLSQENLDLTVPGGQFRNDLNTYHSIQQEFPLTYRVGAGELPEGFSKKRKAQAFQLKGYLLFYDQVLANYIQQISHLRDLFSLTPDSKRNEKLLKSYFPQPLHSVPEVEALIKYYQPDQESEYAVEEAIAASTVYNTSFEREQAIEGMIASAKESKSKIKVDLEGDLYHFILFTPFGELRSLKGYEMDTKAMDSGESIIFLSTLSQSYRRTNNQQEEKYSYTLIYNPINYLDFLDQLTENKEQYLKRRHKFLDHLLSRFGEHFTEYVLLMYALNGKKNAPEKIAEDKATFLSNYPNISRNRGQGYNYADREKTWNTDNISGLERRVTNLMGIHNWKRSDLCHFEVVNLKSLYHYLFKDHRGDILFKSIQGFQNLEDAETAFLQMLQLASERENYKSHEGSMPGYDCAGENKYGFFLYNNKKERIALHPRTYGSKALRDDKLDCVHKLIANEGVIVKEESSESGFYFSLLDENREFNLFRSAKPYATKKEAYRGWRSFLEKARKKGNYFNTKDPYGTGYSFSIKNEEDLQEEIATHPKFYPTEAERDKIKSEVFHTLTEKKLSYTITSLAPTYTWILYDDNGVKVLSSVYNFKTEEQTAAAWLLFKETAADLKNFYDEEKKGKYTFFIAIDSEMPLAQSETFSSQYDRDQAKEMVYNLMLEGNILQNINDYPEDAYGYQLLDDKGKSILKSTFLYRVQEEALETGRKVLNSDGLASKGFIFEADLNNYYIVFKDNNDDLIILSSETYHNSKSAGEDLKKVQEILGRKPVSAHYFTQPDTFSYEIKDVKENIIFQSYLLFPSWEKAIVAFQDLLKAAVSGESFKVQPQGLNDYVVAIFDEANRKLAVSKLFGTDEAAEDSVSGFLEFFKSYKTPLFIIANRKAFIYQLNDLKNRPALISEKSYSSKNKTEKAFDFFLNLGSDPENYHTVHAEDGCRYSFQVESEKKIIAYHPDDYLSLKEKEKTQKDLIKYIKKNKLFYEIKQQKKNFHFEIWWIDCHDQCSLLLKGVKEHDEEGGATKEFYTFWENFHQGKILLYPIEEGEKFSFQAISKGNEEKFPVAVHPKFYQTVEKRNRVSNDAMSYLEYPYPNFKHFHWKKKFTPMLFGEDGDDKQAFRLINKNHNLAIHPTIYDNKNERNEVLKQFIEKVNSGTLIYTEIIEFGSIFQEEITGWYFLIKEKLTDKVLWQSATSFNNKQEAETQFNLSYLKILSLASHINNYEIPDFGGSGDVVNLRDGENTIAFFAYPPEGLTSVKERISHARRFPIKQVKDKFKFAIYNETKKKQDWESTVVYDSLDEVKAAFKKFLALLKYGGNFQLKDNKEARRYGFSLGKVYLEDIRFGSMEDQSENCKEPDISGTKVLDNFLLDVQREGAFHTYVKDNISCCYSFRIVDEQYRVAKHTRQYVTRQERENVRDMLFALTRCNGFKINKPSKGFCHKKESIHFLIKNDAGKVLWRSYVGWSTGKAALSNFQLQFVNILSNAREADFYKIIKNENGLFKITLVNTEGKVMAECLEVFSSTEEGIGDLKSAIYERIIFSRLFPLVQEQEEIYFQFYLLELGEEVLTFHLPVDDAEFLEQNQIQLTIPGSIVWESNRTYPVSAIKQDTEEGIPLDISAGIDQLLDLLHEKSNYQRVDINDCGPFSLEITDPHHVLATHPASYCSQKELHGEIEQTKSHINTEGFHVVEHILLRPRNGAESRHHVSLEIEPNESFLINQIPFDHLEDAENFKMEFSNRFSKIIAGNIDLEGFFRKSIHFNPNKLRTKELKKLILQITNQNPNAEAYQLNIHNASEGQTGDNLMPVCADCDAVFPFLKENAAFCQEAQDSLVSYIPGADPYSFWITVVLPYWPHRFQNTNFREFFEETLRRETPAHVALRIAWVDPLQMCEFEKKYKVWLDAVNNVANCHLQRSQNELIDCLAKLRNVYPLATLDSATGGNYTLGQTKLG